MWERFTAAISTPIEAGVPGASVLVYALNEDSPQHTASRELLEAASDSTTALYLTSQILCEFYSVITNPRRVITVISPADALSMISDVLDLPESGFCLHPHVRGEVGWHFFGGIMSQVEACSFFLSFRC